MKDREFLKWVAERLVSVYGESPNVHFVTKLRNIADATPADHETPNTGTSQTSEWTVALDGRVFRPQRTIQGHQSNIRYKPDDSERRPILGACEVCNTMTQHRTTNGYVCGDCFESHRATYVGTDGSLKGETALVYLRGDKVEAQFDNGRLPQAHSWHIFDRNMFEVEDTE